jgi:asparagine synthase (glutamine-hydrolysing)
MCGISGGISLGSAISTYECWQMVGLGRHRGPDGSQVVFAGKEKFEQDIGARSNDSWMAMGHSRLTIIDLSDASNQPFLSEDGRYALVFNGEIYNYVELKLELEMIGIQFKTTGDTEVLMKALSTWGVDAISKLRGMFAFAFADYQNRKILLARDRYGVKPLHIYRVGERCYFASEIKQFTSLNGWTPLVNKESALQFLLYGVTDHRQETLFSNVERVLPGHFLELTFNQPYDGQQQAWYVEEKVNTYRTYSEAVESFRQSFIDSVQVHMRSDVPIGACLSGGLDSSSIVGVVASNFPEQSICTFTATSELKKIDETKFVNAVTQKTECKPHFVEPTALSLLQDLESLAWHQDEPFGGTSIYAQWCVFQLVKKTGVKVVLDGQGADELLAGYNSFLLTYLVSLIRRGRFVRFITQYIKIKNAGRVDLKSIAQLVVYQTLNAKLFGWLGRRLKVASQNGGNWINPVLLDEMDIEDPFRVGNCFPRNIRDLSDHMINVSNLPMLLRFEDRNSMAHSVESRVPFVDKQVFNCAKGLAERHLIDGDYTKRVLRDGLADFLPDEIRYRKDKIGFQTAEEVWMRQYPEEFKSLVSAAVARCQKFFNTDTERICFQTIEGTTAFSPVPWRVISFGIWAKVFDVQGVE